MDQLPLEKLFDNIIVLAKAYTVIGRFDGEKVWRELEKDLVQIDYTASGWILSNETKKDILSHLIPVAKMIQKPKGESESHHFLRQHVRMTLKSPNTKHIIQLAYNIGQWLGKPDEDIMKKLKYHELKLDKLSTYISQEDIEKFLKFLNAFSKKIMEDFSSNTPPNSPRTPIAQDVIYDEWV